MASDPRTTVPVAPPPANWLDAYPAMVRHFRAASGDLCRGADPAVARKWRTMAGGLAQLAEGGAGTIDEQVARQIVELGLTFRIAGDEAERTWPLTPVPLIIGAKEWAGVERGLIQRATLMEHLAADIYGPQRLLEDGHLPAAVVAGSPFFARSMLGQKPKGGHFLHVYAADLARGPGGEWRVLRDRVRLATGVGYALENRLAISRLTEGWFSDIGVRRLAGFFAALREGIARDCARESPRIALLTPGRFNQTYAEQAHLARYLGLPLVEGRDLVVIEDKLYVRTIAGPKRIDAAWRWINTDALDPLAFDARSELGVANLFRAWARGGVELANCPGVEVLESSALSAFLPRLSNLMLGEAPTLPTVATWWCGQTAEARTVLNRLDKLAIVSAFGGPVEGLAGTQPVAAADLDEAQKAALIAAMTRRPMDYCAQEIVHLSTTPALIDGALAPRPFTIRAFVARGADGGWTVMPGGFARLGSSDAMPTSMMGEGDLSADVCVVDELGSEAEGQTMLARTPPVTRGGGILASQAADNLFWFGRYNERAEMTVRVVRSILGSSIEADTGSHRDLAVRRSLAQLLQFWGAVVAGGQNRPLPEICGSALGEVGLPGGVAALVARSQDIALGLRERFARDFWRIVSRPMPVISSTRPQALMAVAKALIERFSAQSGLMAENMVRGHARLFVDLGRRLERAVLTCRIARHLSWLPDQADAYGVLLDLCDSQIAYRSRYLTGPLADTVRDLVLLDRDNPRALAFQVAEIVAGLQALPPLRDDGLPEEPFRRALGLDARLRAMTSMELNDGVLGRIEFELLGLSDAISHRYFLDFDRGDSGVRNALLG
ncbi:MAG TPA: circularly permuted type 2 ATP-grasp protein [Novosphingobium sp.]|nr:circularly permuted type 2 ATP-grasp protein [Novosphingobium sp.]